MYEPGDQLDTGVNKRALYKSIFVEELWHVSRDNADFFHDLSDALIISVEKIQDHVNTGERVLFVITKTSVGFTLVPRRF